MVNQKELVAAGITEGSRLELTLKDTKVIGFVFAINEEGIKVSAKWSTKYNGIPDEIARITSVPYEQLVCYRRLRLR